MRSVEDEYRQLRRTWPLGSEVEYRLRQLRERPHHDAVPGRLPRRRRSLRMAIRWLHVVRPPG